MVMHLRAYGRIIRTGYGVPGNRKLRECVRRDRQDDVQAAPIGGYARMSLRRVHGSTNSACGR